MTWPLNLRFELRNGDILNDEKPYIIIANHQSALDVLGMSFAWPVNCVVMLKSSLKYLPGFNLCAYMCESVYINRFSKEKAHKTVDSTLHEIVTKKVGFTNQFLVGRLVNNVLEYKKTDTIQCPWNNASN